MISFLYSFQLAAGISAGAASSDSSILAAAGIKTRLKLACNQIGA